MRSPSRRSPDRVNHDLQPPPLRHGGTATERPIRTRCPRRAGRDCASDRGRGHRQRTTSAIPLDWRLPRRAAGETADARSVGPRWARQPRIAAARRRLRGDVRESTARRGRVLRSGRPRPPRMGPAHPDSAAHRRAPGIEGNPGFVHSTRSCASMARDAQNARTSISVHQQRGFAAVPAWRISGRRPELPAMHGRGTSEETSVAQSPDWMELGDPRPQPVRQVARVGQPKRTCAYNHAVRPRNRPKSAATDPRPTAPGRPSVGPWR